MPRSSRRRARASIISGSRPSSRRATVSGAPGAWPAANIVDRPGVAAVLVERVRHEPEPLDAVVAVDRLGGVVEDVEDVVVRVWRSNWRDTSQPASKSWPSSMTIAW